MIITIARECGSGGHEIGEQLAEHYGIQLYDKKKLIEKAKENEMYEEMETFFSEKPMNSLLYAIAMTDTNKKVNKIVFEMMKELISEESFVLIGRCGNNIFQQEQMLTSVFVHAEEEDKIIRTMQKQNIDRKEAMELVDFVDEKRSTFHKYYSNQNWGDARNYHLALNSSRIGIMESTKFIIEYIKKSRIS